MDTATWIVVATIAAIYATGWMMTEGWLLARRIPLGSLLRNAALVAAIGLLIWAFAIDVL